MSKPRYLWWGMVRNMIRWYPTLKSELNELHRQKTTAAINGMPGGGGSARTLENVALRRLPGDRQQFYNAVHTAVEGCRTLRDGEERLQLIRLMYWAKMPMPLANAAWQIHVSESTAKRWHGEFVRSVAKAYGFDISET